MELKYAPVAEYHMGGICGTFWLGLGQEKWLDLHWESHLDQNIQKREVTMVRYQVDKLRV